MQAWGNAPVSKPQILKSNLQRNSKFENSKQGSECAQSPVRFGSLKFENSLELGAWDLEFSPLTLSSLPPALKLRRGKRGGEETYPKRYLATPIFLIPRTFLPVPLNQT